MAAGWDATMRPVAGRPGIALHHAIATELHTTARRTRCVAYSKLCS